MSEGTKRDWHYGCPNCGGKEVAAAADVTVGLSGSIDGSGDFRSNEEENGDKVEVEEVNEIKGLTCISCDANFDDAEKIYPTSKPRLVIDLEMEIFNVRKLEEKSSEEFIQNSDADVVAEKHLHLDIPLDDVDVARFILEAAVNMIKGLVK